MASHSTKPEVYFSSPVANFDRLSLLQRIGLSHSHNFGSKGGSFRKARICAVPAMKKHYDFTKSKPNPYVRSAKRQITIRLDVSTIDYFKDLSKSSGIPYQNLINLYLRDCAAEKKRLKLDWAA